MLATRDGRVHIVDKRRRFSRPPVQELALSRALLWAVSDICGALYVVSKKQCSGVG